MKEDDNILLEEGTNYDKLPNLDETNRGVETFDIDEKTDDEEYNPFIDIPKEINNVNLFYFIYFCFGGYNGNFENNFKGKITIKYLYNYFICLRKNFRNNKIVLNMGSEITEKDLQMKDLLSIINIAIFYEKKIISNFE